MQASMMGILATCCLATSAHAQTSLQMYGIADLGVEWISHVPPAQASQLRVSPNGETGSRFATNFNRGRPPLRRVAGF